MDLAGHSPRLELLKELTLSLLVSYQRTCPAKKHINPTTFDVVYKSNLLNSNVASKEDL